MMDSRHALPMCIRCRSEPPLPSLLAITITIATLWRTAVSSSSAPRPNANRGPGSRNRRRRLRSRSWARTGQFETEHAKGLTSRCAHRLAIPCDRFPSHSSHPRNRPPASSSARRCSSSRTCCNLAASAACRARATSRAICPTVGPLNRSRMDKSTPSPARIRARA